MKRVTVFGIIAMMAVIVLVAAGCGNPAGNDDKDDETGNKNPPPASIESGNVGTLLRIAAGTFTRGSPDDEPGRYFDEVQHSVRLTKDFYMGKYEVTQEQWKAVMGSNPSYFTGEKLPVESVSWYDAILFCNRLSLKENLSPAYSVKVGGTEINWATVSVPTASNTDWNAAAMVAGANGYRLPTDAEWEYACRAGTDTMYSFGVDDTNADEYAWYYGNSDDETHEVGQLKANAWGLYDMHGNVWEWCWDWFVEDEEAYSSNAQTDPTSLVAGASSGTSRVSRGGSWLFPAQYLRSAFRFYYTPALRGSSLGFRLVRSQA